MLDLLLLCLLSFLVFVCFLLAAWLVGLCLVVVVLSLVLFCGFGLLFWCLLLVALCCALCLLPVSWVAYYGCGVIATCGFWCFSGLDFGCLYWIVWINFNSVVL